MSGYFHRLWQCEFLHSVVSQCGHPVCNVYAILAIVYTQHYRNTGHRLGKVPCHQWQTVPCHQDTGHYLGKVPCCQCWYVYGTVWRIDPLTIWHHHWWTAYSAMWKHWAHSWEMYVADSSSCAKLSCYTMTMTTLPSPTPHVLQTHEFYGVRGDCKSFCYFQSCDHRNSASAHSILCHVVCCTLHCALCRVLHCVPLHPVCNVDAILVLVYA